MANEWMDFLAKWRKSHPNVKGAAVMKQAAAEYKKKKGTKGAVNISRVKKEKKEGREGDTEDFTTKKGDKIKRGKRKGKMAYAMDKS
tara:strand:+ start:200 stop:460 length:261 start_codon:yes stop_codon:yes gene_type:complete